MNAATGTGLVTVSDPDGNTTVDDYVQGALAAQSMLTGGTLTSEQDSVPDLTIGGTDRGTLADLAETDGDGNLTSNVFDGSGNLLSSTAPDGVGSQTATVTSQFTSLNQASCDGDEMAATGCSSTETGPAPVPPGGVITPPATVPPSGVSYTLYDNDGNDLYDTTGVYEPGSPSAAYVQTSYQLFKGNSVTLGGTRISCSAVPPSPTLPCATINADGVVTQLAYDPAGDLISLSAPDGNGTQVATTTYAYDNDGEQISQVAADGNLPSANAGNYTTVTSYNADGDQTTVTQAGGTGATVPSRATHYGYDADGNQTSADDARGFTTTTAYNADDEATLVTDPTRNATLTCYDGQGNQTQTVPPAGVVANGLTSASCPASYPSGYETRLASDATTYTFSSTGEQTVMTTPAPAGQTGFETTTYTYDGAGNVLTVSAPPSAGSTPDVTTSTYDSAGLLASQTTGAGTSAAATTTFCYDPSGDQTAVVAPNGNRTGTAGCETSSPWIVSPQLNQTQAKFQTTSSYDSEGELVSTASPATTAAPNGATTTFSYDEAGNQLTSTDPNGVTATSTYTPANQVASISYSASSAPPVTNTYDADGNKTTMADGTGTSSYQYDPFSELISAENGAGKTTGYSYDGDGDLAGVTYPLPASATWATSDTVSYGYDNADVMTSVTDFEGHQMTITPNADGLPASETLGTTGDTVTKTYDGTDSLSAITLKNASGTLQSFAYSDTPAGNYLTETDMPTSARSPVHYTYDTRGDVASMTPGAGATQSYAFDPSLDLTTMPSGASGTYDNAGELVSSTTAGTTTTYSYNADGQRLAERQGSATPVSAGWNGAGALTAYDDPSADMSSASYDGTGLRMSQTTGGQQNSFVWNNVRPVPSVLMDSASAYIYAGPDTPVEQVALSGGTVTYLDADAIGSVRGIVNAAGALTATTSYDAWGNPATSAGLTASTPFGYASGYTDPTGLVYLVNRYYDPSAGQFLSVDPAIAQTREPYAYANGDPVQNVDPTGDYASVISFWSPFGISFHGIPIPIPAGELQFQVFGAGLIIRAMYASWAAANDICNWHISFAAFRHTGQFVWGYNQPIQEHCPITGDASWPPHKPRTRKHTPDGYIKAILWSENKRIHTDVVHVHP